MQSPGLGVQFLAKTEYTIGLIERYPESGRVLHDQVRRMATDKIPFHVVYTLETGDPFNRRDCPSTTTTLVLDRPRRGWSGLARPGLVDAPIISPLGDDEAPTREDK
jgi:hypothetical protein